MDVSGLLQVFPKTLQVLNDQQLLELVEQFKRTLCEELMLPETADSSRWLPVFLKVRGVDQRILEIAEFEYLQHVVYVGGSSSIRLDPGQVAVNPTIQFAELYSAQPPLQRPAGLYCFYRKESQFSEYRLSIMQALIIDILQAERKFQIEQLCEQAHLHKMGKHKSATDWQVLVGEMIELGLLVRG